jgi:flagellar motor switch/type III secretory pathway protein FliN
MARVPLEETELQALERGDIVVVEDFGKRPMLRTGSGFTAAGQLVGDTFHVEEVQMTEETRSHPVMLEVELCRVPMTLGNLARLAPGSAVPLAIPQHRQVILRIENRAFAHGELIEVDGSLGVRITQLGEEP